MLIRSGITRIVFIGKKYTVKIPQLRWGSWGISQGILANLSERDWSSWEGVCPQLRCWFGGFVAVYPTCRPHGIMVEPDHDDPWWKTISPGLVGCDPKLRNIGLLNKHLVWLDYAAPWNGCPRCKTQPLSV